MQTGKEDRTGKDGIPSRPDVQLLPVPVPKMRLENKQRQIYPA
jgi:hypothetical protein